MSDQAQSWLEALSQHTEQHYRATQRGLLLPQLSAALKTQGFDLREVLAGRRLKAAIEADASDLVELVQHPLQHLVWAVVPKGVELPANKAELFPEPKVHPADADRLPSFQPGFWGAFVYPIGEGCRRLVLVDRKPIVFQDVEEESPDLSDGVEVTRDDLIDTQLSGASKAEAVRQKIADWVVRKGFSIETFYVSRPKVESPVSSEWLSKLISLEDRDLARISIPLDILKRIM